MAEVPAWASVGEDQFAELDNANRSNFEFDPREIYRFYMPKGTAGEPRKVIFLDNLPFNVYMHQFARDGFWGNWESCPLKNGQISKWCPLCEKQAAKEKVSGRSIGHYTILDYTGYETKEGDHRMPVKILPARGELIDFLKRRRERHEEEDKGGLVGAMFTVIRDKKSNDSLGNDWEYERHVDLKKLLKKHLAAIKPQLDYYPKEWGFWDGDEEDKDERSKYILKGLPFGLILEPRTAEELKKVLGASSKKEEYSTSSYESYDDDGDDADDDDDDVTY